MMSIKELIRNISDELVEAQNERESLNKTPLFIVEKFELELNCILTKKGESGGGLNLKVLTLDDKSLISEELIQKIKLIFGVVKSKTTLGEKQPKTTIKILQDSVPKGALPSKHHG